MVSFCVFLLEKPEPSEVMIPKALSIPVIKAGSGAYPAEAVGPVDADGPG